MTATVRVALALSLVLWVAVPASAQSTSVTEEDGSVALLPLGHLVYGSDRGGGQERIWMLEAGEVEPVPLTTGRGDDPVMRQLDDQATVLGIETALWCQRLGEGPVEAATLMGQQCVVYGLLEQRVPE